MDVPEINVNPVCSSAECEAVITVVVPVYNRAERVMSTLRCLEEQTLRPLEIILVDNNSTDGTLDVLEAWKRRVETPSFRVKVLEERQPGAAAARNKGLMEVVTPVTMFFDSDDLMAATHCRRVAEGFKEHPYADIVGWDCSSSKRDGGMVPFYVKDAFWGNIHYGTMSTQRYAAKTDLFRKAGCWNTKCLGWDDVELGLRLLNLAPKMVKLAGERQVEVVHTPDSITGHNFSDKAQIWELALDLMEKEVRRNDMTLRRYINLRRAILAGDYRLEGRSDLSRKLFGVVQSKEPAWGYRMINRLAVLYRGLGLRGAARLLRPFFK